jgi:hypothetical protein
MVDLAIDHGPLGPRNAGIGDKDVEAVVEFDSLGPDSFFDFLRVLDVDLVGLAWQVMAGSVAGGGLRDGWARTLSYI